MRFPDDADIRDYIRATVPYVATSPNMAPNDGTLQPMFFFKPLDADQFSGVGVLTGDLLSRDGPYDPKSWDRR